MTASAPGVEPSSGRPLERSPGGRSSARLLAGLLPVSVLGFGLSAVADRPVFALWAVVFGAAFAAAASRPAPPSRQAPPLHGVAGAGGKRRLPLLVLAVAAAALLALVTLYAGDLREGFAAYLPARPALISSFDLSHDAPLAAGTAILRGGALGGNP